MTFAAYTEGAGCLAARTRTRKRARRSTKGSTLTSREYVGNLIGIKLVGGPRAPPPPPLAVWFRLSPVSFSLRSFGKCLCRDE